MSGGQPIFLSYNRHDLAHVKAVRERMAAAGLLTFLDQENLNIGQPWPDELEHALEIARAVLVFVGRAGFSGWQKKELGFALDRQVSSGIPVVPVLLPGSRATSSFLFQNSWVDLRTPEQSECQLVRLIDALRSSVVHFESIDGHDASIGSPYLGLRAFQEEDAGLFFGRELFIETLLGHVSRRSIVAVVGASGSGKSSVVRAGLVPRLRRERGAHGTWEAVVHTPSNNPFGSLAQALIPLIEPDASATDQIAKASTLRQIWQQDPDALDLTLRRVLEQSRGTQYLLVVVDQFEELFTSPSSKSERDAYLDALLRCLKSQRVKLLIALRADYYRHAIDARRELCDGMAGAQVNLGPLAKAELQQVIEGPAKRAGLNLEPGLVDTLLRDMEGQPNALPLLEYALESLWERRQGRTLTHDAYRVLNGLGGVITHRAEETLQALPSKLAGAAEELFLRLVHVAEAGAEGTDTRRRARRSELSPQAWEVASRLAAEPRLLTISRDFVEDDAADDGIEVAHEALIAHWERLQGWVNQERQFLSWRQNCQVAMRLWQVNAQAPGALLTGIPLEEARRWRRHRAELLSLEERHFIAASVRHDGRLLRRLIGIVSVSLVLALSVVSVMRTDRYQVERVILTNVPGDFGLNGMDAQYATNLGAQYAAAGLFGSVGAAELSVPRPSRLPSNDWLPVLFDPMARLRIRATSEGDGRPSRQLLLGLLAAGELDVVEQQLTAAAPGGARVCAHAVVSAGFSSLGLVSEARRHFDQAERLLKADRGVHTKCMAEAAAWLGDRTKLESFMNTNRSASGGALYTDWDGALLFALAWQSWLPEFRALLSNGYMVIEDPSFVPEPPIGLQLGLESYARNGSEEDVRLLNDTLRGKEAWLREAWAWSLEMEGRVEEVVQEQLRSPNLGRPFVEALRARAFRVDSFDWCRDIELAFPDVRDDFRATCADVWHPRVSAPPSTPQEVVASKEDVAYALGLRRNLDAWSRFIGRVGADDKMALERRFVAGFVTAGGMSTKREQVLTTLSSDETKAFALQLMSVEDLVRSADGSRIVDLPALLHGRAEMQSLLDSLLDAALSTQHPSWLNRERAIEHAARSIAHQLRFAHANLPRRYELFVQRRLAWAGNEFSTEQLPRARAMCRALTALGEYALARDLSDNLHDTADRRACYADIIRAYAIEQNLEIGRRLATPLGLLLLLPGVVGSPWSSKPALN